MAKNDGAILSQIKKLEVALHNTVEPQFNEGPRDWQNVFIIRRFHYIEVLFHDCIVDSIKASLGIGNWPLGIGHLSIRNNVIICLSDQKTIASVCPIPIAQSDLY